MEYNTHILLILRVFNQNKMGNRQTECQICWSCQILKIISEIWPCQVSKSDKTLLGYQKGGLCKHTQPPLLGKKLSGSLVSNSDRDRFWQICLQLNFAKLELNHL